MIEITVEPPRKTDTEYEVATSVRGTSLSVREAKHRLLTIARGYGGPFSTTVRFGYKAQNFTIAHDVIWDTILPLSHWMNLLHDEGSRYLETRNQPVRFRFTSPVPRQIIEHYERRAQQWGHEVEFVADRIDYYEPRPRAGMALAFGGGKDSRLILGMHRELGIATDIYFTDLDGTASGIRDLPETRVSRAYSGRLTDRLMPAFMSSSRHVSLGKAFGEVQRETPWQLYYEWTSARSVGEFNALMQSLGTDLVVENPLVVTPYNIVQRILTERYPELYAHQESTGFNDPSEKNLQVTLLKLHHAIPHADNMDDTLFEQSLRAFVTRQLAGGPDLFGKRNHREIINREMRGIIHAHADHPVIAKVIPQVPEDWAAPWINFVHGNLWPEIPQHYLSIYHEYAADIAANTGAPPPMQLG